MVVRIVEISIGSNHKPEADIAFTLLGNWAHLADNVRYTVGVREDHTLVVFVFEDDSLQLLKNVPESIAGVDNVESKILTPEQYGGDERIIALLGILFDSHQSDSDSWVTYDSADDTSEENDDDNDDDDERGPTAKSDPVPKSDPADQSEDVVDEDDISDDDDEKSS